MFILPAFANIFYSEDNMVPLLTSEPSHQPEQKKASRWIHQCPHCFTIYSPELGDEEQDVLPGTSFDELPIDYSCPLCEAPKSEFVTVEEESVKGLVLEVVN